MSAKKRTPASVSQVFLVDDHPLWRETLAKILRRGTDVEVVGEADNGEDALVQLADLDPDVIVLDVDLPGIDGIETAARILESTPDARILMLSASQERKTVTDSLRAGASGYLVKTAGAREVADAIGRVCDGELVLPPELSQVVLDELRKDAVEVVSGIGALTDAEREVLELMAAGKSNKAIAESVSVSAKTVEARVTGIYTKLGLEPGSDDHRRVLAVLRYLDRPEER